MISLPPTTGHSVSSPGRGEGGAIISYYQTHYTRCHAGNSNDNDDNDNDQCIKPSLRCSLESVRGTFVRDATLAPHRWWTWINCLIRYRTWISPGYSYCALLCKPGRFTINKLCCCCQGTFSFIRRGSQILSWAIMSLCIDQENLSPSRWEQR